MRRIFLSVLLVAFATFGLSFIGVEVEKLQDTMPVSVRLDASIFSVMYPIGVVDPNTMEFQLAPYATSFDYTKLLVGLNLKLPLGSLYIRGAGYLNLQQVMNYQQTNQITVFGKVGAGLKLLFLDAEGGVRWYYRVFPTSTEFQFAPEELYIALGLSF